MAKNRSVILEIYWRFLEGVGHRQENHFLSSSLNPINLVKPHWPCFILLILEELPPGLKWVISQQPHSLDFLWMPIPSVLHLSNITSTNHSLFSAPPSRKLSKFSALTLPSASFLSSSHLISEGHLTAPGPASSPSLRCLRCCYVFSFFHLLNSKWYHQQPASKHRKSFYNWLKW